jgi:hypothetical protein
MKMRSAVLIALLCITSALYSDPLLVAVLMVKNEAPVMVETLQPLVNGGIKDFLIFDTGSTDGTQAVTKKFFKQYKQIKSYIIEEPFIDFATSRNHALESTRKHFPHATFMVMLDAEWYTHHAEGLLKFCNEYKNDQHDSYAISIEGRGVAFHITRLFRCSGDIYYSGVVHECVNQPAAICLPAHVYFEWKPSAKGQEKSAQRWKQDVALLLTSYQKDPNDPRTLFYLGQTYHCNDDLENAYLFYSKRAEIQTGSEEDFSTIIRLGVIVGEIAAKAEKLDSSAGKSELKDSKDNLDTLCPLAIKYFLKAFSMRPHRAEPLICIANHYLNKKELGLAFLFAVRAAKMPYPVQDDMLEKQLYDFTRYDILGKCAWAAGEYEIGEWATLQALKVKPNEEYLQHNLSVYRNSIAAAKK